MLEKGIRKFVEARSYSEPRVVSLKESEPEAYVEWGGPSQFDIDEPPAPGKFTPHGKRLRYDHPQAVPFMLSNLRKIPILSEDLIGPGPGLLYKKVRAATYIWDTITFRSPYGGDIVFHLNNEHAAITPVAEGERGIYPPTDNNGDPYESLEDV